MEFVGRTVRKEFKGFGVFSGVVKSYDYSSGFFKIGYEDGDSEEIDFSELAALLDVDGVLTDHSSPLLIKNTNMAGRGPEGRRIVLCLSNSGLYSGTHYINGKRNADKVDLRLGVIEENDSESKGKELIAHSVKKEQFLDLNMDLEHPENNNQDIDLGGYVKGEKFNGNQTRGGKRRKLTDSPKTSSESVIRRSSRRRAKSSEESEESEEPIVLPSKLESEESEEPIVLPSKLELPPSTGDMNLDDLPVLDLFSVYAFLRSFSTILFLSPFDLGDFVASIRSKSPSLLIDSIHVSLLRILKKHLEFLSSENSTSATNCLRDLNWDLLDSVTWPIFMAEYLLMKPDFDLSNLKLYKTDYYKQPESSKVKILQYLCDDVVEAEPISSEVSKRSLGGEYTEFDQLAIKKRKGISGSCSEEVIDETADWNSDECWLCKMDGNLICCDGCPAAFHSKCVGIAANLLPPGDWFCPECVVDKKNGGIDVSKVVRGAELLGVDPHGRLYYCCCGYILVSDNCEAETSFHYYHMTDLTAFINALDSSEGPYQAILNSITNHWSLYEKLHGATLPYESSNSPNDENTLISEPVSLQSSEISAAVPDIPDPPKIDYLNLYSFARVASSVAGEWTRKPSEKVSQIPTKSLEELIAIQMKVIAKTSVDFCWSNVKNLSVEARKEKCGWCLACQYPTDDGNCLFYLNDAFLESFSSDLVGFDSGIERKDRLIDVMCHILCIEERLHGLLLGPWLNPNFPRVFRKSFVEASDIAPVKDLLLMLELNIRPRALSNEWLKHVDSAVKVGSASHIVTIPPKNVIGRKRPRLSDSKPISSKNASSGLGLFWWRGGGLTRQLFNWKVLPRSLARKAARQGGGKKIEGILYPENSDFPKRTKVLTWRAAVESAVTVEQLALQIRELDANIKWEEIENTIHPAKMDKESLKYMRSFKKAIVRRKSSEGAIVKYLLDFGKRRFIPDTVIKHGSKLQESSSERKKYWVEEPYVPLFLLKGFEDKRIALKSNKKTGPVTLPGSRRFLKFYRKDCFEYLFSKPEKPVDPRCGRCDKDVPFRDAVSCQLCEGFFHKNHAKKTSRGREKGIYTCHNCHVGDTEKVSPKKKKKKKINSRKTEKFVKITEKSGKGKELAPVRRSNRAVKVVSFQIKKKAVKKKKPRKKQQLKSVNELLKPKGKRGRPRKIKKENFRKKRSRVYPTYWLNGLLLSRKPNDERVMDFRARNHLVGVEREVSVEDQPKCCLCCEPEFRSSLNYVSCVSCGEWYHGDAFGLKDEHLGAIIGFKCHKCRERAPPVCPHLHESKLGDAENGPELADTLKAGCEGVLVSRDEGSLGMESMVVEEEVVDGV